MKKSVALLCLISTFTPIAYASIATMYAMAQDILATHNYAGYTEYWRYGGPNDPEPRLEHVIAYFNANGDIARADAYDSSNGSYTFKDQVEMSGPLSEQGFRQTHILPFGGNFLGSGGGSSSGSGSSGGSTGGGDSSGSGGGGSSIGDSGSGGSGGGGGGGGPAYACTSAGDGYEVCERIR